MRYHATGRGGLCRPIPFGFVTATMCAEMLHEHRRILPIVPRSRLAEQLILLQRYDPQHRADQFRALSAPQHLLLPVPHPLFRIRPRSRFDSMTEYFGRHTDGTGGVLAGAERLIAPVRAKGLGTSAAVSPRTEPF